MDRRIQPTEPISELRRVPIIECGEPLVSFLDLHPSIVFDRPRYKYLRETLVRESLAERLVNAASRLSKGFKIAVIEGWRPPHIQKRMYLAQWALWKKRHPEWSDAALRRIVNRFVAPLGTRVPPPHSTGGAVDLILVGENGRPSDHDSPYEAYDPRSFRFGALGLSQAAQETRAILKEVLEPAGITNYPTEYWHWTYGDQGWAYRGGHAHAIYGSVVPTNYEPNPADVLEAPIERV